VITAYRLNLIDFEFRLVEYLLSEYEDVFAMDSDDYGRTERVYHCSDREGLDRFINPGAGSPGKTGGCALGARGLATTWGYRRVRQLLVFSVVLARKKNEEIHFCVDNRTLTMLQGRTVSHCPGLMTFWTRWLNLNGSPLCT
jgi:hypothetical protein